MKDGIMNVKGLYNTYTISLANVLYIDTDPYRTMTVMFVNGTELRIEDANALEMQEGE